MDKISEEEILKWIDDIFEENYQHLQLEGGHKLSNDIKKTALLQVKAYYKKLKHIAHNVSEVEVKLTLSNQMTANNRRFSIEGVVDLINEGTETNMYDIKTHEVSYVRSNITDYQDQLNIYRHIWEGINEKQLSNTMIISTGLPEELLKSMKSPSLFEFLKRQIDAWNPLVKIETKQESVDETIKQFSEVVDRIEEGCFSPPGVEVIKKVVEGTTQTFATRVCRNCDVRYSCLSYRKYTLDVAGTKEHDIIKFYSNEFIDDEKDEFIEENL